MFKINDATNLKEADKEVYDTIIAETDRLNNSIELIASENVVSSAVLEAAGSILTNKYAEGYPSKRYYGGCVNVDIVEELAKSRILKLFSCEDDYDCNVQPHSGSGANMGVYMALLETGDTLMGMDLSCGGHLTHGLGVNFSGKLYNVVSYKTDDNGLIDYDELEKQAMEAKPKLIVAGASAYPREIDFKRFKEIADKCGALLMVDMAHIAGLVATDLHMTPFGFADVVTTTTHKTLRGPRGGVIFAKKDLIKKVNSAIFPGIQGGPLEHIIAAKAVAFKEALDPKFKEYQTKVKENADAMAKVFLENGIDLVSGGTDNHLMLLNLISLEMSGKKAERILEEVGITTNKNGVPNDPKSPMITSGVRIGSPAMTSRGFGVEEAKLVAQLVSDILKNPEDETVKKNVSKQVLELCEKFPVYQL